MSKNELRAIDKINRLKEKFPHLDFTEFKYEDTKNISTIICPDHGKFESNYKRMMDKGNKFACPACSKAKQMAQRYNIRTTESAIEEMSKLYPDLDFSKFEYKGAKHKSIVICKEHGEFETTYEYMVRTGRVYGCPSCTPDGISPRKYTTDRVVEEMQAKFPELNFSKFEYENQRSKSIVICPIHGEFITDYRCVLSSTLSPCPYCSYQKVFEPVEFLKNKFPELDFSKYVYTDTKTKSIVICKKHGEFESSFAALKKSVYGCGKCGASFSSSSYEKEIVEFIETIYDKEIVRNTRKLIRNEYSGNYLELDIYLPDINLAIEFNGKYFHTDENIANNTHGFKSAKEYHDYKLNKCNEIGIDLIHIFEMDYVLNKEDFFYRLKDKISNMSNI